MHGVGGQLGFPLSTHNHRLLLRLDGETIGLDGRTSAGEVGLLVLALDLKGVSKVGQGRSTAVAEVARLVWEDKSTFIFLETGILRLGCRTDSKRVKLDQWFACRR